MHCSYLTSPKKTVHGMSTDDTHDYLVSVARELGVNVNSEKRAYNESKENAVAESMSYREQDPLNEFVGGPLGKDEGLVKAFSFDSLYTLFSLFTLTPNSPATLTNKSWVSSVLVP